ncbi:Pre-mRNA-processing factor 17 [Labeo rohita]|uniref:Pre-mRNA-processing factor 17 n=1 Tax=Labeo rohita TaxID=84645 RepID=A0ABQ8LNU9_LABRO|nr:Pre-mRNA-processing factor 17 [Labeo rohita]
MQTEKRRRWRSQRQFTGLQPFICQSDASVNPVKETELGTRGPSVLEKGFTMKIQQMGVNTDSPNFPSQQSESRLCSISEEKRYSGCRSVWLHPSGCRWYGPLSIVGATELKNRTELAATNRRPAHSGIPLLIGRAQAQTTPMRPADERPTTSKMAAAVGSLVSYGSDSDSENESESGTSPQKADPDAVAHLQPLKTGTITTLAVLNSAPEVAVKEDVETGVHLDPALKEFGPANPFRSQQMAAPRNMLSGYAEPAHLNDFMFEQQRRTFSTFGYALDPSVDTSHVSSNTYIGAVEEAEKNKASDIDSFLGPWAKYQDEKDVAKPSEDEQKELDEITAKRQKRGKNEEEAPAEEKTILHIKDAYDYQGRSYLHIPQDVGGVSAIRLFPVSGHLLLSCSMDCKIKLWEVYNDRRCVRTFIGHSKAVRDVCFNNTGTQFLSAAYDRYLKLWDSETGQCIARFTNRKVPYCVKFNPDEDKQNLFVAGMSDKKIVQWDIRSGEVVQEYDRHLGAVNTITFVDENRRFVSTSDDKSLRVWEDIPVDFKYIAEPSMHSMPAVTLSPNGKWLACQSMDNQILIFGAQNRFRLNKKKIFKGHMVAGYACQTTKLYHRIKAHDKVCISALWHPHETSKVITCGWDGQIKLWD